MTITKFLAQHLQGEHGAALTAILDDIADAVKNRSGDRRWRDCGQYGQFGD